MSARSQEIVIEVEGMDADEDAASVAASLRAVHGVSAAVASRSEGRATVTADPTIATPELLRAAVVASGFTPGEVGFPE